MMEMNAAGQPGKNMSDPAGLAGRGRARKGQLDIARVAAVILAVLGFLAAAAVAVPAGASAAQRGCSRDLPVTHAAAWVQMHAVQTCGFSYRAWGDWGGKYRYGPYTKVNGNYSTACDEPACQSRPDGKLLRGGYQVKRTGKLVRTFTSSAIHVTALARRACGNECIEIKGNDGVQPGWFEAKWVTNANVWYVRGVAKCGNGTRNTILKLGGWVKSIGLFSKATCTSSYPSLTGAAHDVKHCSTCSYTRTWDTIPVKQG